VAATKGNLLGGWAGENFWDGGIRIGYSFTAGLLIHRYQLIIKNKLGFFIPAALLVLAFISPHLPNNGIIEACIVTMYFPLLVSLGAGSTLHPKMIPACKLLGDISYPLYMSHYAFIWIFGNYFLQYKPTTVTLVWIIIGGSLLLIFFSWLIMKFYDMPVRKFFTRLRMKRN
jgi:peptidoglycan/LPS O-acetylase OafA/YrhL